jgi:50S ribosomal subunit-associated GTPase HflX
MEDVQAVLNPNNIQASYTPQKIQHFPIMNSKLNIIAGEEGSRRFDARVIVTNPDAISEMNEQKMEALMQELEQWITQGINPDEAQNPDEQQQLQQLQEKQLAKIADYYKYH